MALSTQNVWWRNSSAPGTFSGLFPRVRAYADPKPLPQAGGVRHRYTRTPPPRHSPGWLGGTLRAGPGPLIDPHGAHGGPGPTPPIPPLGHPTRHPALVIWLRKRRLAGHPKNVLKNAAPRFGQPASLIHHSRHESFVFFGCTDLSPHTREKKKLSRNCAEFGVRALISVTNGLAAPALPSHVFYVETARCQTRRQPEKHGPDAHLRRHRRLREIYGVVCRVRAGRSSAAANARQCVIWSLILGVWRPAARATICQV